MARTPLGGGKSTARRVHPHGGGAALTSPRNPGPGDEGHPGHAGRTPPPPSGGSWRRVPGCLPPVALPRSVLAPGTLLPFDSDIYPPENRMVKPFSHQKVPLSRGFVRPANCGFLVENRLVKPFSGCTATREGGTGVRPPFFRLAAAPARA